MTHEEFVEGYQTGRLVVAFDRRASSLVLDPLYLQRITPSKSVRVYGRINWAGTFVLIATPILFILIGLYLSWWFAPLAVVPLIALSRIRDHFKNKAMVESVMENREIYESLIQRGLMRVVER